MYSQVNGNYFSHTAILSNYVTPPTSTQEQSSEIVRIEGNFNDNFNSSGAMKDKVYDVFLSFRGEDTRRGFTGHLYRALQNAGFNTFMDDSKIPKGDDISRKLVKAIQGSRMSLVVFSTGYADSTWCLEELVHIMKCWKTLQQLVVPIFYDVEPSEVRKQRGTIAEAFKNHEERFRSDKVRRWRTALTEAANLSGWDVAVYGSEATAIKEIVDDVSRKLLSNTNLFVALYPVGVDSRVNEISLMLNVESDEGVHMIGICGMGGMGKTTIAKAIYNKFSYKFGGNRSFLANVRQIWDQQDRRVHLQEQLLFDILKSKIEVGSVDRGIQVIRQTLGGKRVLVIVDDVDHIDQLNALARSHDWFGPGSRILITTRNQQLLKELKVDATYMVPEMNDVESLELFSWHAFGEGNPENEYFELSGSVVNYCGGLPLALEVLGSFLFCRTKLVWTSALEKLRKIPPNDVQQKLRISFDALSEEDKIMFLDISCFFIGMDRNYVLQILEGCDLFAEIGLQVLLERCLLTINGRNKLMMHDLLRDMGRAMVREKFPQEPGQWSRLWLHEDIFGVLTQETGTEVVEGLALEMEILNEVSFPAKAFSKMRRLRLLQLHNVQLTGSYKHLSKELRWLCWNGFPLEAIPSNFYQRNLVAISMKYSNLRRVWENPERLDRLKILNLSHSHRLIRTPDFSMLPNLKKLVLKDCKRLYEVHPSIGNLKGLVSVNLKDCKILHKLPKEFYKLKSLETLILSGCSMLDLDEDLGKMESLRTVLADNTGIRKVPHTIRHLRNLKELSLCGLRPSSSNSSPTGLLSWLRPKKGIKPVNLLPPSFQGLSSLTTLCLMNCNLTDDAIPRDLGRLSSLVTLRLDNNNFNDLPSSLKGLSRLRSLSLDNCRMLESILDLPTNLKALYAANCIELKRMPNMSEMLNLVILELANCHELVHVPGLDELLKSITLRLQSRKYSMATASDKSFLQGSSATEFGGNLIPGDDIPECFTFSAKGSSVLFEVPRSDYPLKGVVVCIVYSYSPNPTMYSPFPSISVVNKTQRTSSTFNLIALSLHGITCVDHLWQGHISNDLLKLKSRDKVEILLDFGAFYAVKKTGVFLVWDNFVISQPLGKFRHTIKL